MLRPWLFVGFSGHRKLADPALTALAIREVLRRLEARTGGPLATVSSAASGADTLFAEVAAAHELPWTVLLPFPLEEFRKDFAGDPEAWQRIERLLPRAVRTVVEPPTDERSDAYLECGVRTVDECDVLIAVWNGEDAAGRGGTGDIVAYARSQEKPLAWIHSETHAITEENFDRLPLASDQPDTSVVARATPDATDNRKLLEDTFHHHNEAAKRLRPRAVNLNLSMVLLFLLSSALSFATLVFAQTAWLQSTAAMLSLFFLGAAFVLPWFFRRAHREWTRHRLRAEICRSAMALWPLPEPEEVFPQVRLPVDQRWQRSFLLLRVLEKRPPPQLESVRQEFEHGRIEEQLDYFQREATQATARHRWMKRTASILTFAAIIGSFAGRFHLVTPDMDIYRGWRYVVLVLPLLATALLSAVAALDLGRRSARYAEMATFLRRSRTQLRQARTWSRVTRVVVEVERSLLLEIWEWYSVERFAPRR